MDFPLFHMDYLNNRFLIATIAAVHVIINHAMAVGGIPLVLFLEYYGFRVKEDRWDLLAYKILTVFFIITTSLGAMTGVGIWFSAALVNPAAIGSLIRVFFSAWFTEWIVFVAEVLLIMIYYLSWKKMSANNKKGHLKLGAGLAVASWLTMAIIVAILGFMMDPGNWLTHKSLINGFLNPIYLPQLAFRTPLAMMLAGAAALFVTLFATRKEMRDFRPNAVRLISFWQLIWLPHLIAGSFWYAMVIPENMQINLPVANTTIAYTSWYETVKLIIILIAIGGALLAAWGILKPKFFPRIAFVFPIIGLFLLTAHFERVREFVRKPYAVGNYLYSNGLRVSDYPLLQKEGILKHGTYVKYRTITPENELEAGKEVFMIACSRCHTLNGITSMNSVLDRMYGNTVWKSENIYQYLGNMHQTRPFMPPFPGNDREKQALAKFLTNLQFSRSTAPAAQINGVQYSIQPQTERGKK